MYYPLYVRFRSSFIPLVLLLFFFYITVVRHDDTSGPYFPRVFFAAVVIVYYHRTDHRTMLIAKSIFLCAFSASVQPWCLSNHRSLSCNNKTSYQTFIIRPNDKTIVFTNRTTTVSF